jgi:hypothetical protein
MIKWRNKIEIKQFFTEDESDQSVLNVLNMLIPQLNYVIRHERRLLKNTYGILKENLEYITDELENIINEFEWIKDNIEHGKNPSDYNYLKWVDAFNDSLDSLYDLGNMYLAPNSHPRGNEKFLWVG